MNYTNRNEFLAEHRRVIQSRLSSSVNEICENRARSREELQTLYRRIVSYILLEVRKVSEKSLYFGKLFSLVWVHQQI